MKFAPIADARVKSSIPDKNYGSKDYLRTRTESSEIYESYLQFHITGELAGPPKSAKLRLFVTDGSPDGGKVYVVANGWSESTITWNNAPGISGSPIASAGSVAAGTWVELDVTSAITGNGIYSFGTKSASTNSARYSSKEGANPPELVIER